MVITELDKAISMVPDGAFITYSGMQLVRAPMAAIFEIVRQNKKGLTIVSIPNPLVGDVLVGCGLVKKMITGFNGFLYEDGFVISPNFRKAVEQGKVELYETDVFEILQGLKAATLGEEEIEVPGFFNSDYIKVNKCKLTDNGIMTKAISPDYAIIHAQAADSQGNVYLADPLIEELIINASKYVIVTVEEVKRIPEVTISKDKIQAVCVVKNGALPTACFGYYNHHGKYLKNYVNHVYEDRFEEYVKKYILDIKSHEDFIKKIENE